MHVEGKPRIDLEEAGNTLKELEPIVEILSNGSHQMFTAAFGPWAIEQLRCTPVKFTASSQEQRLRRIILKLLRNSSASPDAVRLFLEPLMDAMLTVMKEDNEDNAILALNVIIDMHKLYRGLLEPFAQKLVDFVLEAFEAFPETCEIIFEVLLLMSKSDPS